MMTMDKEKFETAIAADPSVDLEELGLSAEERLKAKTFQVEMQRLDDRISSALSIDVPALELPELPEMQTGNVAMTTSDDEGFERAIAVDPSVNLDDLGLSAEERLQARAFQAEMQKLDGQIASALSIDVPELEFPELPEIESENVVPMQKRNKPRFGLPAVFGLAASIALAAVLGLQFFSQSQTYPSLAAEIVAHLEHEPQSLVITSRPVSDRRLTSVVGGNGVALDQGIGLVTYAKSCVINGKTVPHLVVQGETGPVTLLLMPDEKIEAAVSLVDEGVNGVILPVGDGSIAIIGEREERLDDIEEQVVDSVSWTI